MILPHKRDRHPFALWRSWIVILEDQRILFLLFHHAVCAGAQHPTFVVKGFEYAFHHSSRVDGIVTSPRIATHLDFVGAGIWTTVLDTSRPIVLDGLLDCVNGGGWELHEPDTIAHMHGEA